MNLLLVGLLGVFTISCTNKTILNGPALNLIPESSYYDLIKANSRRDQVYSGLYNSIDLNGVIVNSEVSTAQVDQQARVFMWDENKYTQEKVKAEEKTRKEAEFFVSFFTPDRKHDDLHKNKTLWKIFLDVDGKRYEGKVAKIKLLTEEIQSLYPLHNRFSTPYSMIFPIPMKQIEAAGSIKLTITGPVGSSTLNYARSKQ